MAPARTSESGFTIVEVMVSALILVVGLLGLFVALDSNSHLSTTVLRQQVATTQAQQAMEKLKGLKYDALWLKTTPTNTGDGNVASDTSGIPTTPTYWVGTGSNAGKLKIVADFSHESSATLAGLPSAYEPFVTSGSAGSGVDASSTFTVGSVSGTVYRFISYVDEPCTTLIGTQDAKRLTVAVVLTTRTGSAGANKPIWLSGIVPDPDPDLCL